MNKIRQIQPTGNNQPAESVMDDQEVTQEQSTQPQGQDISPDTVIGLAEKCTTIHSPTPLQRKQESSSNTVGSDSKANAPSDHEEVPNACEQKMVKLISPEAETLVDKNKCHNVTNDISG